MTCLLTDFCVPLWVNSNFLACLLSLGRKLCQESLRLLYKNKKEVCAKGDHSPHQRTKGRDPPNYMSLILLGDSAALPRDQSSFQTSLLDTVAKQL